MSDDKQDQPSILDRLLDTQSSDPAQLDEAMRRIGLGDLTAVRDDITARFQALSASGDTAELTDADVELMESLVELGERVGERVEALSSRSADLAARMQAVRSQGTETDQATEPNSASVAADPDSAGSSQISAEQRDNDMQTPSPAQQQPGDDTTSASSAITGRSDSSAGDRAADAVTAAGPSSRPSAVPLDGLESTTPATSRQRPFSYSITAAADIPGIPAGSELSTTRALSEAAMSRGQALTRLGPDTRSTLGVASIRRQSSDYTVDGSNDVEVITAACDETQLDGGSLLAAGNGWCSPSEYLYEFCPQPQVYGLVDLPTVLAPRGGVRYPVWQDSNGNELFPPPAADVGFHFTEEETKTETKPCMDIPCPVWNECRLDVDGICIKAGILQQRAFMESVDDWMNRLLVAHAHKINGWVLNKMVQLSTLVDIPAPVFHAADANGPQGFVDPHGPGALQTFLSAIDNRAMHVRTKYWLGFETTLEMVAPYWLVGLLRADITKKVGIQEWAPTRTYIEQLLAARNIRVQWVTDWQDAWYAADPSLIGGNDFNNTWPSTLEVLLYPAGTFYRASLDVITIENQYDSTLLSRNEQLKLFTEEGIQICTRCYESTRLRFHLCPNGLSGATSFSYCADPTPPPENEPANRSAGTRKATAPTS